MQRRLWVRALLALWSVWFTAAVTEPAGLFVCAMHSGTAGMQMGAAGHAHGGRGAAKSSSHGAQHASASAHASHTLSAGAANDESLTLVGEPTPPQTHDCTCLGECCTVAPATLPAPHLQVALGVEITRDAASPAQTRELVQPAQLSHLLPFANGPPRAA